MAKKVSVLVGSLYKGSFARKVAQNVTPMFPAGYEVQTVEIGHLPFYNFDYDDPNETDFPIPEGYTLFCETIKVSDGILFVMPKNNHTAPACLKNAVDVGSKLNTDAARRKAPADIIGHSVGKTGGYGSQKNLCLTPSYSDILPTGRSEVFLSNPPTPFDGSSKLIESACDLVQGHIDQLVALIGKNLK